MVAFPVLMGGEEAQLSERAKQRIGTVVNGKWTIDKLLGIGGMGVVYAATHRNKKKAALKMLHPELTVEPTIKERFLREGYVANSVNHPGSVKVDDDDIAEDGSAYLVIELLEGETLEHRWERKGNQLPVGEVLSVAEQLLDVLVAAHGAGIVHRDLKPENVFLTTSGQIKVLDFGIARLRESGESSTATRTGTFLGTPVFMAPEQARGRWELVDHRTDLWAVGAMLYTLITGHYVHEGGTVNETLARAMTQPAASVAQLKPELPQPVVALIDKALAYDMNDRFHDAQSMQHAVRLAYHSQDVAALAPTPSVAGADLPGTRASAGDDASAPQSDEVSAKASGPAATGVGVTRTSPDLEPKSMKRPVVLLGAAAAAIVLVGGIALAVSGGKEPAPTSTAAEPAAAVPPQVASPVPAPKPAPHVGPVVEKVEGAPVEDLPKAKDEPEKGKDRASAKARAKRAAQPANGKPPVTSAKPTPKPKPERDPFSVRK